MNKNFYIKKRYHNLYLMGQVLCNDKEGWKRAGS